jgi:hypothetical protein
MFSKEYIHQCSDIVRCGIESKVARVWNMNLRVRQIATECFLRLNCKEKSMASCRNFHCDVLMIYLEYLSRWLEDRELDVMEKTYMLPKPEVGQLVRLENYDERLIITSISDDGGKVDLVSETDPTHRISDVPCLDLLLPSTLTNEEIMI